MTGLNFQIPKPIFSLKLGARCFMFATFIFFVPVFINLYGDFYSLNTGADVFFTNTIFLCVLALIFLLVIIFNLFPFFTTQIPAKLAYSAVAIFSVLLSIYFVQELRTLSDSILFRTNKRGF